MDESSARDLAHATVAESLTIEHVLDREEGRVKTAREILSVPEYRVLKLRRDAIDATCAAIDKLTDAEHRFACVTCGEPVRILSAKHPTRVYYFAHAFRGAECPLTLEQRGKDEINASRFKGQPEGFRHKRMKRLICASLRDDAAFSDVDTEKHWPAIDGLTHRRSDVIAKVAGAPYAFEAQVSNTSALDVAMRCRAYRHRGVRLAWFTDVVPESDRRMYLKDLGEVQAGNIFQIDEETVLRSTAERRFMIRCYYGAPYLDGEVVHQEERVEIVPFAKVQWRESDATPFYFDSAGERERLEQVVEARWSPPTVAAAPVDAGPTAADRAAWRILEGLVATLIARGVDKWEPRVVLASWLAHEHGGPAADRKLAGQDLWRARTILGRRGFTLPRSGQPEFYALTRRLEALLSAELGYPVGYRYSKLVQVAHIVAEAQRPALTAFLKVARHFGNYTLLVDQDGDDEKWGKKYEALRDAAKQNREDPASKAMAPYEPEDWWREFCLAVYPEVVAFAPRPKVHTASQGDREE